MRVGTLARSLPELLDNVREYGERLPLGGSRSKDLSR